MAKVDFGWNEDNDLNSTFANIGGKESGAVQGETIGIYSYEGKNYLISKVTMAMRDSGVKEGDFDVREVAPKIYRDGSYAFFSNNEKSDVERTFESFFNREDIRSSMNNGETRGMFEKLHLVPSIYQMPDYGVQIVTGVKAENFNQLLPSYQNSNGRSR